MSDDKSSDDKSVADEALTEVVAESSDQEFVEPIGSWAWLITGFLAAIVCFAVAKVVIAEFQIPLPAEYAQAVEAAPNGASTPEMDAIQLSNHEANCGQFLFIVGASMAFVFGWGAGFIHRRLFRSIIGCLVGSAAAYGIGLLVGPSVVELSKKATSSATDGDMMTIGLHALQWFVIGVPVVIAVGIAVMRPSGGLKVFGIAILAAVLGGLAYMIGGTLLDSSARIAQVYPQPGNAFYVWTCVPPMLLGLFLSRVRL